MNIPPEDTDILGDVAVDVATSIFGEAIAKHSKTAVLVVKFIRTDRGTEEEIPYTETWGFFKELAAEGKAVMQIGDGTGGAKVKSPEPV